MDELEISGKRYISTRRAGKENKYHSDYIGQLIRGGKVKGQKVGRSWYVDESSLATYLGKEVKQPAPKEMLVETVEESVEPVLEEKVDEIVELVVEEPIRATPWKKIPEIVRVESIGQTTPVVAAEVTTLEEEVSSPKEEIAEFIAEVEKDPIVDADMEGEEGNQIRIRNSFVEEKKKNITYVASDAPVFPVKIRKQQISVAITDTAEDEESVEDAEESSVVPKLLAGRDPDQRVGVAIRPLQYGAVAMLGVLAFILVGGMSYLLSYKTTVEGDQMSASITLRK